MSSTNSDSCPLPPAAAMARGTPSAQMALFPAAMVPKKKMRAKTRKVGMGRASKKEGRASMTPVTESTSLKIMMSQVLSISFHSKAVVRNRVSSLGVKRSTKIFTAMAASTPSSTGR